MQPIRISDLKKVNPIRACEYFNNCFKDPSAFTVVVVGNIDPAISIPLILQYLVCLFLSLTVTKQRTMPCNAGGPLFCRVGYLR
jgi:hypothetical protein